MKQVVLLLFVLTFVTSCTQDVVEMSEPQQMTSSASRVGEVPTLRSGMCIYNMLKGVPHYYEWDTSENPKHYNWCGHAALKMVGAYHGVYHTLGEIHDYFWANSPGGYAKDRNKDGKYASWLWDLRTAARDQYGFRNTPEKGEVVGSVERFFKRLKDCVDYKKPAIVASTYLEPYGHMYPVVGYFAEQKDGVIDYSKAKLYLRDSKLSSPRYTDYDIEVDVKTFYNHMISNNFLIIKP